MKAVCLISGGLDSSTCMAIASSKGFEIYALSFHYGQRHEYEIQAAKRVALYFKAVEHVVIDLDIKGFDLQSSLINRGQEVPTNLVEEIDKAGQSKGANQGIPSTYVPARNLIFLSYAICWAEALGMREVFIGANAVDYSGYPDCRPKFIKAFENAANLATKAGAVEGKSIKIRAPLINMSKAEIIRTGLKLGVDFSLTSSCYQPDTKGRACGRCQSCQFRLKGFREAGLNDPISYQRPFTQKMYLGS